MGRLLGLHAAEGYREHSAAVNVERRCRANAMPCPTRAATTTE